MQLVERHWMMDDVYLYMHRALRQIAAFQDASAVRELIRLHRGRLLKHKGCVAPYVGLRMDEQLMGRRTNRSYLSHFGDPLGVLDCYTNNTLGGDEAAKTELIRQARQILMAGGSG